APGGCFGGGFPPSPAPQAMQTGPRSCPSCNAEVPNNFKFSGVCGSPMASAPAPQPAPVAPQPVAVARNARLTLIRPDGSEGGMHTLHAGENLIGRDHGPAFENDGYLSPTHAALFVEGTHAVLRDLDSLNGVFV